MTAWDDPNSNVASDITAWMRLVEQHYGEMPTRLKVPQHVYDDAADAGHLDINDRLRGFPQETGLNGVKVEVNDA